MKKIPKCEKCDDNLVTVILRWYDSLSHRWYAKMMCDSCAEIECKRLRARNIPCRIEDLNIRDESENVTFS